MSFKTTFSSQDIAITKKQAIKDKRVSSDEELTLCNFGRRGGIRTRDPLHPMQVRYQAALHAEERRL